MKNSFAVLAAAAGLAVAQDFSGQPDCAIPCLEEAIPEVGCDLDDTACQCTPSNREDLLPLTFQCLTNACNTEELVQAQEAAASVCADFVTASGGLSSLSSAIAGATDSTPSATATDDLGMSITSSLSSVISSATSSAASERSSDISSVQSFLSSGLSSVSSVSSIMSSSSASSASSTSSAEDSEETGEADSNESGDSGDDEGDDDSAAGSMQAAYAGALFVAAAVGAAMI